MSVSLRLNYILMGKETKEGLYQGIIEKDEKGNFFCGPYLLDYKMVTENFSLGDKISIKKLINNPSNMSVEAYPKKSIKFSLANGDEPAK